MPLWLARLFLWITRWKPEGALPPEKRFVLIAAPHTTNWDFVYLVVLARVFELQMNWMGKASLFRFPLSIVTRATGGIPIRRDRSENSVRQTVRALRTAEKLAVVVPAEGTRGAVKYWKSGFYHIARLADVPIVMGYLDYARRRGGFGPALHITGDIGKDMDEVRAFYSGIRGKYPELEGEIRLKEEATDKSS